MQTLFIFLIHRLHFADANGNSIIYARFRVKPMMLIDHLSCATPQHEHNKKIDAVLDVSKFLFSWAKHIIKTMSIKLSSLQHHQCCYSQLLS